MELRTRHQKALLPGCRALQWEIESPQALAVEMWRWMFNGPRM